MFNNPKMVYLKYEHDRFYSCLYPSAFCVKLPHITTTDEYFFMKDLILKMNYNKSSMFRFRGVSL